MIKIQKIISAFAKVKTLKIGVLSTQPKFKVQSLTDNNQWEITNPIENLIGALVTCEYHTFKLISRNDKFHIGGIKFTKIQSEYDTLRFLKGGSGNKLDEIFINVEVQSNNSQEELNEIHKKVINSCPVYQMLSGAGVKITQNWRKVEALDKSE